MKSTSSIRRGTSRPGLRLCHQCREQLRRRHHPRPQAAGCASRSIPTARLAYVANSGSNSISVLDLKARREIAVDRRRRRSRCAPSLSRRQDPRQSPTAAATRVSIIDTATRTVRAVVEGCPGANDVVILPDSSKAFAACSGGHQVMAIALAMLQPSSTGLTSSPDRLEALLDVGRAAGAAGAQARWRRNLRLQLAQSTPISEIYHRHRRCAAAPT